MVIVKSDNNNQYNRKCVEKLIGTSIKKSIDMFEEEVKNFEFIKRQNQH